MLSLNVMAAAECQGEMVVPMYSCINPAGGMDVRLYIMEFQTCSKGKIVELDRTVSVMNFENAGDEVEGADVQIQFQAERSYHDRARRVDDVTFQKPVSARASFGEQKIEMTFSNRLEPMFAGDLQHHMPGTFRILSRTGKVIRSGKLSCDIIH